MRINIQIGTGLDSRRLLFQKTENIVIFIGLSHVEIFLK